MTISRISLRQWTDLDRSGPHPCSERKRISAVDLSGSIERKTAVAAGHCAGFAGLQPLAMAMLAIVAWSLSVVDVAIILGPGNPPTLAVISWQWLTQGDADQQTKGALASLLLMLLLAAYVLAQLAAHYSPRRWHSQACHTFITRHYAGEFFTLNRCAVCGSAGDPRGSVDDQ
ncbi:transport system permease [Shigella flexneri 2a]|nr:transport system permease [Shigella flexneri 2a]SRK49398.1 transport system permease [Shigella flexneri]